MLKKIPVVMLPTNEKANTFDSYKKRDLYLKSAATGSKLAIAKRDLDSEDIEGIKFFNSDCSITGQHLYFLSDEEIKEGDWYILIPNGKDPLIEPNFNSFIFKCVKTTNIDVFYGDGDYRSNKKVVKKIIATTDESLKLPKPSQSFIDKFIKKYNAGTPITHVNVEYEIHPNSFVPLWIPKINLKDNTITIKSVKDSWTREEVKNLFDRYNRFINFDVADYDNWIDRNL